MENTRVGLRARIFGEKKEGRTGSKNAQLPVSISSLQMMQTLSTALSSSGVASGYSVFMLRMARRERITSFRARLNDLSKEGHHGFYSISLKHINPHNIAYYYDAWHTSQLTSALWSKDNYAAQILPHFDKKQRAKELLVCITIVQTN